MLAGQRFWIDLLNAQETWKTDDSMLRVIPEEAREFDSNEKWPRLKALAFLHNNVQALRLNYTRLERGEALDLELLSPVLEGVSFRLTDWRRDGAAVPTMQQLERGEVPAVLRLSVERKGLNAGSAHLRFVVQRAVYHFARYLELRLVDPSYPGSTPGMFRVLPCAAERCSALVPCPVGIPNFCSDACATETGHL